MNKLGKRGAIESSPLGIRRAAQRAIIVPSRAWSYTAAAPAAGGARPRPTRLARGPCFPSALHLRSARVGWCPCFAWLERGSGQHHHRMACVSRLVDTPGSERGGRSVSQSIGFFLLLLCTLSPGDRRRACVSRQEALSSWSQIIRRGHENLLGSNPCLCCMQLSFLA